jgi:hypothetical protein
MAVLGKTVIEILVKNREWGKLLVDDLGFDPSKISEIQINIKADEVVTIVITALADENLLDLSFPPDFYASIISDEEVPRR